jgi:2,3-bisphosphoglycerate-dependent phosphoglycerate mutase
MVIVFETHATSLDNEAGLASGWFDVGLSPAGERQARELGDRRRQGDLACVYCSDLARAVHTAEIAFGDRGPDLPIVRDARLRECDYGTLTRHPAAEIEARRAGHITQPFPGGESYADCVARASAWLADARTAFAGRTIAVIGHRATFYAFESLLNGVPLEQAIAAPWSWRAGWIYRG